VTLLGLVIVTKDAFYLQKNLVGRYLSDNFFFYFILNQIFFVSKDELNSLIENGCESEDSVETGATEST
jgi:hypothetical protein